MTDYDELYKNYLHPDNWLTEDEIQERLAQEEFAKICTHESVYTKDNTLCCFHCGIEL